MYAKKTLFSHWRMGATFRQRSQSVLHPALCGKSVLQQKSGVNVYSDGEMIGNAHFSLMTWFVSASSFHLWLNEKWRAIPVSSSETRALCFIPAKKGKKEKIETAGGGCYRTILMVSVQQIFEHLCSTCYFCFRVNWCLWGQDLNLSKMRLWYIWGHWGTVPSGTVFLFFFFF